MTQPALESFKRRGVVVKAEVTEGTDSVPTAGTNGILLLNGKSGTEFDKKERNIDRAHFTSNPFVVANKRSFIEGEFELYAPATPGAASTSSADCEPLLLPAGMAVTKDLAAKTTLYTPISTGIPTATAYWWHVNKKRKHLGCRNDISSIKMEIGERFMGNVRILGTYTATEAETLPTITLPGTVPVVSQYSNSKAYINDGAELEVLAKMLEISFNNELASREYTSQKFNRIHDRLATWKMRIAHTDLTDFNPWTIRDAATTITARYRTFEGGNLYSQLAIRGQIEAIEEVDIDGDYGWDLSGPCIASNSGNDEFTLLFGDTTGTGYTP